MSTYNAIRYNVDYANVGSLKLISTQTASSVSSIEFTTGIDSTYDEYWFVFNNIHPATDNTEFLFNMSTDGGSTYAVTKTTTIFRAYHNEAGTSSGLDYPTTFDLAQSTAFQALSLSVGNGNDENCCGTLQIFNPSSNTFVKHFIANNNEYNNNDFNQNTYIAGYGNTTSAVDAVQFKMSSGNIDAGTIQLFGVKQ